MTFNSNTVLKRINGVFGHVFELLSFLAKFFNNNCQFYLFKNSICQTSCERSVH